MPERARGESLTGPQNAERIFGSNLFATEKKLAGAALTSFMKKCESDAAAVCDTEAADKKLSGAAKTSFTKKCVKDATGA